MTWAILVSELKQAMKDDPFSVLAYDCRGHGLTKTVDESTLSLEQLSKDLADIVKAVRPNDKTEVILVGHSMGGAVVVEAAATGIVPNCIGVVVIDVVEGTAMEALS
ncbi:hypothetical protein HDV05_008315, partial [Chytridiales sp. JEL 0842]